MISEMLLRSLGSVVSPPLSLPPFSLPLSLSLFHSFSLPLSLSSTLSLFHYLFHSLSLFSSKLHTRSCDVVITRAVCPSTACLPPSRCLS